MRLFNSIRSISKHLTKFAWCIGSLILVTTQVQAETYYFHNDQLGTPQIVTDSSQQVVWKGEYDPFGTCTETVNLVEQNIRFPGQYFDQESELLYNYFRTYDPSTGRYVESDPIGLRAGLSTYSYVGNSPLRWFDSNGLTRIEVDVTKGILTVDPEVAGRELYSLPITSGEGSCQNNMQCARLRDKGPLPPGNYSIDSRLLTDPGFIGDIARNLRGDWGDWRVPIAPDPGTDVDDTQGNSRDGFFLHGGIFSGSAGCIDFGGGLFGLGSHLTNQLKDDILNDPNYHIPLTVK